MRLLLKTILILFAFFLLTGCSDDTDSSNPDNSKMQQSLALIANYSQDQNTTPTVEDYHTIGVNSVTLDNLNDINFLISSLNYDAINSSGEIFLIIQEYEKAKSLLKSYIETKGSSTAPTIETYRSLGINDISNDTIESINKWVSSLSINQFNIIILNQEIEKNRWNSSQDESSDTTPPIITLLGDTTLRLSLDTNFTDPGATAIDAVDGNITITISGNVDIHTVGNYTLTYTAIDNSENQSSATRIVFIFSEGINHPPVAENQSTHSIVEDTSLDILLNATDEDNDTLNYQIVLQPSHGTLTGTAPTLTYTPNTDYFGTDIFTFRVNDTQNHSNTAQIPISITPVNDLPVVDAGPDHNITIEDELTLICYASDTEGDTLSYYWYDSLGNEVAQTIQYTLPSLVSGNYIYTCKVSDGEGNSSDSLLISVDTNTNHLPEAENIVVLTSVNNSIDFNLTATDKDGDDLVYEILQYPKHGILLGTPPLLQYEPTEGYYGEDYFLYRVYDEISSTSYFVNQFGDTNVAPVFIHMLNSEQQNNLPTGNWQRLSTEINTSLDITLSSNDSDNDDLNFTVIVPPIHGQLSGAIPYIIYEPTDGYLGDDVIVFETCDMQGSCSSGAEVIISVINDPDYNNPPVAISQRLTTTVNAPINIILTGSDPEGRSLSYSLFPFASDPDINGTLPHITYTPQTDFIGTKQITFIVNDGKADSTIGQIEISVVPEIGE